MPTPDDRRAVLILLAIVLTGLAVRMVTGRTSAPGGVGYRAAPGARPEADSVAARTARLARPLRRGERIDVDAAPVGELTRLPRIGPALARRIVADREARGPFGSLAGLARVPGIGPASLDALAPHVRFSAPAAPGAPARGGSDRRIRVNAADSVALLRLPGVGPALAGRILAWRREHGPFGTPDDLRRVRGIGPATLERLRSRIIVP